MDEVQQYIAAGASRYVKSAKKSLYLY